MKYNQLTFGHVEAIVNKLGGMDGVERFLAGNAEVVPRNQIIDCDADPVIPDGENWVVEEHQKGGQWKFDATQIELYVSNRQQGTSCVTGVDLRKELAGKPVLNANVLDHLLKNPHLIPSEWKKRQSSGHRKGDIRHLFFWGTIYRDTDGKGLLWVRCLEWNNGYDDTHETKYEWESYPYPIDESLRERASEWDWHFGCAEPAVLRTS